MKKQGRITLHVHEDREALVQQSLLELHGNVTDLNEIRRFEAEERKGRAAFFPAEDILKK